MEPTKVKQLTKEQAIAFAQSGEYKTWTDDQIIRFQLFQEKLCMGFSRFHEAMEKVLGRPVFTHEFGSDGLKKEYLGCKEAPTLEEILNMIPEEKRIIILNP
jgi:hypothetical protein